MTKLKSYDVDVPVVARSGGVGTPCSGGTVCISLVFRCFRLQFSCEPASPFVVAVVVFVPALQRRYRNVTSLWLIVFLKRLEYIKLYI